MQYEQRWHAAMKLVVLVLVGAAAGGASALLVSRRDARAEKEAASLQHLGSSRETIEMIIPG